LKIETQGNKTETTTDIYVEPRLQTEKNRKEMKFKFYLCGEKAFSKLKGKTCKYPSLGSASEWEKENNFFFT